MSKSLPSRTENYSEWYNELVKRADLAENSAVRGCMVIKPYGYSIWEKMQRALDEYIIEGIKTTIPFHQKLMKDEKFRSGDFTTKFLEDWTM